MANNRSADVHVRSDEAYDGQGVWMLGISLEVRKASRSGTGAPRSDAGSRGGAPNFEARLTRAGCNRKVSEVKLDQLLEKVRACQVCAAHLPFPPRPVVRAAATARLLIVGQAPGTRVHDTGIPWNDPSGDRLRDWLQLSREAFYNERRIAIIPTGLCYPGRGRGGDLPPRPECAPLWHPPLRAALTKIKLTLVIGQYAQTYYLADHRKETLADTVKAYAEYLPKFFPLPHPSPRNLRWFKRHPWFEAEVLPALRAQLQAL
jgi:uracil-DNA glycosylase